MRHSMLGIWAAAGSGEQAAFTLDNSLIFNDDDTTYLNRTPSSEGDRRTFTISIWLKRCSLGSRQSIAWSDHHSTAGRAFQIRFDDTDVVSVAQDGAQFGLTDAVFRDVSAWYHFVVAVDTTQASASDQLKMWVNGVEQTFSTLNGVTQNKQLEWNDNTQHVIGRSPDDGFVFDGYISEYINIDGQALTASSFGEFNTDTNVWTPVDYSGSYGTNGFRLDFADNGDLGNDISGNNNDFTANNFNSTDQTTDTPNDNYCTLNAVSADGTITLSDGNLTANSSGGNIGSVHGTYMIPKTGKWYWEITATQNAGGGAGIARPWGDTAAKFDATGSEAFVYARNGDYIEDGSVINGSYGSSWSDNDIISVLYDADAGDLIFWLNGSSQGTASSSNTGDFVPAVGDVSAASGTNLICNFGQKSFTYTPPAGYESLSTANLSEPDIIKSGEHFSTIPYDGSASTPLSITGVGFQPDIVWIKRRSAASNHHLYNAVGGAGNFTQSSTTGAEVSTANGLSSFDSDGFTLEATGGTNPAENASGHTYVSWNWKCNGSGSSNTDGSITSTVSANTSSGVSVVEYTGNSSAGSTIGHGLGVAPNFIAIKALERATNWYCYHHSEGADTRMEWNTSDARTGDNNFLNATDPTSTVFEVGGAGIGTNYSGEGHVAFCFAEVEGFSKIGFYNGNNNANGPFINTGFRPAYVVIKRSNGIGSWTIKDTARDPYNLADNTLFINVNNSEAVDETNREIDILSNGFKIKDTNASINASSIYLFMAFAEQPFKYAVAR